MPFCLGTLFALCQVKAYAGNNNAEQASIVKNIKQNIALWKRITWSRKTLI